MIENIGIIFTVVILLVYLLCFIGIIFYSCGIPVKGPLCCHRENDIESQSEDRIVKESICSIQGRLAKSRNLTNGSPEHIVWAAAVFAKANNRLNFAIYENPSKSRRSQLQSQRM